MIAALCSKLALPLIVRSMILSGLTRILRLPFQVAAVASGAKDFTANPVLGSQRLNQWGLHVFRRRLAQRLCSVRRRRMASRLPTELVALFNLQGYIQIDNFLPAAEFDAIRRELCSMDWAMLEMAQPPAVTHRANLDLHGCKRMLPAVYRLLCHPQLRLWLQFAAGCSGQPAMALQRITSDRENEAGTRDPQSCWHSDTFHSTGKVKWTPELRQQFKLYAVMENEKK